MRSSAQEKLLNLLYRALKPLVHLLLESGIGHREFSEIAKKAFVDVATKNYGIRGRATNISRVAVMTGLTRKEVKRIRDEDSSTEGVGFKVRSIPGAEVLHRWHTDNEYVDEDGSPKRLVFAIESASPGGASEDFTGLVKKYAGDIPPGALRTELIRSGAVVIDDDGFLRVVRREYSLSAKHELIERAFDLLIPSLLENIAHNVIPSRRRRKDASTWPDYQVQIRNVPEQSLGRVADQARAQMLSSCKTMDDSLYATAAANRGESGSGSESTVLIGMYYAEGRNG